MDMKRGNKEIICQQLFLCFWTSHASYIAFLGQPKLAYIALPEYGEDSYLIQINVHKKRAGVRGGSEGLTGYVFFKWAHKQRGGGSVWARSRNIYTYFFKAQYLLSCWTVKRLKLIVLVICLR
jgi:hypothetical protein